MTAYFAQLMHTMAIRNRNTHIHISNYPAQKSILYPPKVFAVNSR